MKSFSRWIVRWILLSVIILQGCSALELPEYKTQAFDKYEYAEIKESLAIAIQPFTKREDVEKQFGANLLSEGILPVLVIAENHSSDSSYLLSKDHVTLMPGLIPSDGTSVRQRLKSESTADALTTGAIVSAIGGLSMVALPLAVAGIKTEADANEIRYNLTIKELHTRTISPGRSVSGFVYFRMPEKGISAESWLVHVDILDLRSKRSLTFDVPFKFKWDGK